ncbi:unnamed protein product [Staurois parvus]|uniref:Uncharacterized protein n=1 Tax=Staurois parvus TaxID=386267 RepID=A0ABN9EIH2_9NEOB|nr:unnamed protein product [Staurois parvus]
MLPGSARHHNLVSIAVRDLCTQWSTNRQTGPLYEVPIMGSLIGQSVIT